LLENRSVRAAVRPLHSEIRSNFEILRIAEISWVDAAQKREVGYAQGRVSDDHLRGH
jgi:uncharacterized protein YlxP (DUF503 family)